MIQIEQATVCANSLVLEMSLRNWLTYLFNFVLSMLVGVEWDKASPGPCFSYCFQTAGFHFGMCYIWHMEQIFATKFCN